MKNSNADKLESIFITPDVLLHQIRQLQNMKAKEEIYYSRAMKLKKNENTRW